MDLREILIKTEEVQNNSKKLAGELKTVSEAVNAHCERIKYVADNAMKILLCLQKQWDEELKLQEEIRKKLTPQMVKDFRKKLGLSQKAFAELLGVSLRTVQRWERGESKPSKLALSRLAQLFVEAKGCE